MIARLLRSYARRFVYFEVCRIFAGDPVGGYQLHRTWTLIVLGRVFVFQIMLAADTFLNDGAF